MKPLKCYPITLLAILFLSQFYIIGTVIGDQNVTLKILDLTTSQNSITVGSASEPIPKVGLPFSVKIVLEGSVSNLMSFQVSIKFNYPAINCTTKGVLIPYDNPDFIFYGLKKSEILSMSNLDLTDHIITIGVVLLNPSKAVSKTGTFTLCIMNFTASKVGSYTLDFDAREEYTMLLDNNAMEIPITQMQSLRLNVLGAKSPPTAAFTISPVFVRANKTVTFDASASFDPDGNIVKYIWDFGDGSSNETGNSIITHIYIKNGVYNVTLTVVDDDNLMDSASQILNIGRQPIVAFTISPSENLKPGNVVAFNASGSSDVDGYIVSYIWIFGDGHNETTVTPIVTHIYENRGVYKIVLTVLDDEGLSNSTAKSIQVGTPPNAHFEYSPPNPSVYEEVTFNAAGSQGIEKPIVRFNWFSEDALINETTTEPFYSHTFPSPGEFTITLTVYDEDGLYNSTSKTVTVTATASVQSGTGTETIVVAVMITIIVVAVLIKKVKKKPEEVIEL